MSFHMTMPAQGSNQMKHSMISILMKAQLAQLEITTVPDGSTNNKPETVCDKRVKLSNKNLKLQ
jgi:hypothetical protein